jgi:hypothetical protein
MVEVRSLVAVLVVGALAGCGEQTKREAATRTPTPSPTVKPAPPAERAKAELRNYLVENTQNMRQHCVPADELVMDAIAAVDCDYRHGPRGDYLLFDSKADLEFYYGTVTASSKRIRGTKCSGNTWGRTPNETRGWLGLYKRRTRTLLIWTDNEALVVGTIHTRTASTSTLCGLWRESG